MRRDDLERITIYNSDSFGIIHSGGEESQRGVGVILATRAANCVEKVGVRVTDC